MNTRLFTARLLRSPSRAAALRRVFGLAIAIAGCAVLVGSMVDQLLRADPRMVAALIGSGTAAAATALGTLPVLFSQNFTQRTRDCFLGFGAGVMLGATAFSLIIPALAAAREAGAGQWSASLTIGSGIIAGVAIMLLLARAVSGHGMQPSASASHARSMRRAWLFIWAVALHNLPEGLAMGVAYGGVDLDRANALATGISIQDVPEGLVVALALRTVGYGRLLSAGLGMLSGVVEPIAAVAGVALIGLSSAFLPVALAAAAGAMLFVIVSEVIPESHQNGHGLPASLALVGGFVLMTVLDTALS